MNHSIRARLRNGDPAAFGEVFREHADAVYRNALWTTGNWATAEDVVSLTFLEAWRLREKLRPDEEESLRPWLLGIATNVLRNTARSARRHQRAMARLPRREPVPDVAEEVTGRMADAEQVAAVKAALGGLRRSEREVFGLCVWSGLDYASAAQALGIPVGTVRSRLSRARRKLRERLSAEPAVARARERPGGTAGELGSRSGQIPVEGTLSIRQVQEIKR